MDELEGEMARQERGGYMGRLLCGLSVGGMLVLLICGRTEYVLFR